MRSNRIFSNHEGPATRHNGKVEFMAGGLREEKSSFVNIEGRTGPGTQNVGKVAISIDYGSSSPEDSDLVMKPPSSTTKGSFHINTTETDTRT